MSWKPSDPPEKAPFFFTWSRQRDAQPLEITGGRGARFETADGGRWLDLAALVYNANLGHGHPRMIAAIRAQAERLALTLPNAVYPEKIALAEALLAAAPPGFSKVFFTLGGAEANENAIKLARLVTGRFKLMSRYRSYHGATMGALSLTGDYRRPPLEPGIPGVVHVPDHVWFGRGEPSDGADAAARVAEIMDLEGGDRLAAVIMEPIPGANGVLVPPPGYWKGLRAATEARGTLLIADEVLTGFGRTGRMFAVEHEGVVPDMITVAKGLTAGYGTLGAVLVHERVARHFDERMLYAGLTGYAHPLAVAAGLEALAVYRDEKLVARAAKLEDPFLDGMVEAAETVGRAVRDVRGRGLLGAIELNARPEQMRQLEAALNARRVLTHVRAGEGTLILSPPLCIEKAELREGLDLVASALREVFA
jgi:taurine--2-oxoglutarate transaminase